jgi:phosphoribosylamine--glycine ligase
MRNVLVVGKGGREHALMLKLAESVDNIYCAPGNGGTAKISRGNVPIDPNDFEGIAKFVKEKGITLTVVGPEDPLVNGIVDYFNDKGLVRKGNYIFGPTKAAARLEGSKVFAKRFMKKHGIPTADFEVFNNTQIREAMAYARERGAPLVVKAYGLAAGKGSVVCHDFDSVISAINDNFVYKKFGDAGNEIVIEDFMEGEEASILSLTDGVHIKSLVSSQDHKPIGEGDTGKNTGGMGAYAPAPVVTPEVMRKIQKYILWPTLEGMNERGSVFRGCLYTGLMIKNGEPKVVEYNIRLGDPEAQVVLPLLESDLHDLFMGCVLEQLITKKIVNREGSACCVVMAAKGYPGDPDKGDKISGLGDAEKIPGVTVYHAGTKKEGDKFLTNGGRVLGVNGVGENIEKAIETAYKGVNMIEWDGEHHRNDIGQKALKWL